MQFDLNMQTQLFHLCQFISNDNTNKMLNFYYLDINKKSLISVSLAQVYSSWYYVYLHISISKTTAIIGNIEYYTKEEDFNFDKPLMRTANSINYWRVSVCAESPKTPRNSRVLDSIVGIFYHNINVIALVDATLVFVAERQNKNWWKTILILVKWWSIDRLLHKNVTNV